MKLDKINNALKKIESSRQAEAETRVERAFKRVEEQQNIFATNLGNALGELVEAADLKEEDIEVMAAFTEGMGQAIEEHLELALNHAREAIKNNTQD